MKTSATALIASLYIFGIPSLANASDVASVSKRAPRFVLERPSGGELASNDYAGRPLVLNVFASWCPPCRQELPRLARAARAHAAVSFVGVDEQEAASIASAFVRRIHLPYPIALDDGQFAASYGASALPETIFIDGSGTVRAIYHGAISQQALAQDLALIDVSPAVSR